MEGLGDLEAFSVELAGHVATVTMRHPPVNAQNRRFREEIVRIFDALHDALCHCADCRRHAGARMVAWAMVPAARLRVTGRPKVYRSSEHGRRHFCEACGTGLFHFNEAVLPGIWSTSQTGTLDDPGALPARAHIQVAERIAWMETAHELPAYERYPG